MTPISQWVIQFGDDVGYLPLSSVAFCVFPGSILLQSGKESLYTVVSSSWTSLFPLAEAWG